MARIANRRACNHASGGHRSTLRSWLGWGVIAVAVTVAAQPSNAQTRAAIRDAPNNNGAGEQTLAGCSLPLPGGADRDSGIGDRYIRDHQGQPFLFAPALTVRHTITDNVTLASEGEEQTENASQLVPSFTFCQNRHWLQTQFDYSAQLIHYWNDSDRNEVYQQAQTRNTAVLVDNTAFLDLDAGLSQQPKSLQSAFSGDNELVTGNREDVVNFRVSPYLNQELGRVGSTRVRYAFEGTRHDEQSRRNTTRHIGSLRLTSPAAVDPLSWTGSVRSEQVERNEDNRAVDDTTYFDDAYLELGYRVWGRLTLTARGGVETKNVPNGSEDRFGSEYWEAGGRWTNGRTSIEARYGERFFGDTYYGAISHRAGHLTGELSYRETQEIRTNRSGVPPQIQGTAFEDAFQEAREPAITISKRLNASATYEKGRSTVTVNAFDDRAEFLRTGDKRDRYGANALWQWRFQPRTTLTPRVKWQRINNRSSTEYDIYGARLSLTRMLSPKLQAGITARRQERDSDGPTDEYEEQAITLEFTRLF